MVALQHQHAHPRQNLLRLRGHIAGVRQNANGAGAVDAVIHALGGVVGRGKGRDPAGDVYKRQVPPQALGIFGGGLLIELLLQLSHAEDGYLLHGVPSVS